MKFRTTKIIILCLLALFVFFFSNDFGIIDVKKTAIITAVGIDKDDGGLYEVTVQVAVPEASDEKSKNLRAQVSAKGGTVGGALKNIGDTSGWFPNLSFCNLVVLGSSVANENVMKAVDYFAKTVRIQDSALLVFSDTTAKEILSATTPLDNVSSFALQKIILKSPGFDDDVANMDIKNFAVGYYGKDGSNYMPLVKIVQDAGNSDASGTQSAGGSSGSGGAGSSGSSSSSGASSTGGGKPDEGTCIFDARTTVLFKDGIKVGELSPNGTLMLNALTTEFKGTTIDVNDVEYGFEMRNFLLTVFSCRAKTEVLANENGLTLKIGLDLYCKISDQNAQSSDSTYNKNLPLPDEVKQKAQTILNDYLTEMIETSRQTGCDFLHVKQKLYRHAYRYYGKYKDNCLSVMKTDITVSVNSQK